MTDVAAAPPKTSTPPEAAASALDLLDKALDFVPVPNARPGFARADEATGLTALELALRLEHITRVTEHLHLIDSGHVHRSVSVDLDLRALTTRQREALAVRLRREPDSASPCEDHATSATAATLPKDGATDPTGMIWVPIARQSRHHLAPVTVVDHAGNIAPRLTTEATAEAVIAGMARLLRIQVAARIAAMPGDHTSKLISVQARWLIEHAMAHLIRHGHGEPPARDPQPTTSLNRDDQPTAAVLRDLEVVRQDAHSYLAELPAEYKDDFGWLLNAAITEQLLIVMVPANSTHEHLKYEAPLIPADPSVGGVGRRIKNLLPINRDFTVSYRTQIPRTVRSYHVTVDAPEEISVRRFVLVTDADASPVERLAEDFDRLARHAGSFTEDGGAVYQAELQDALARTAALIRLRHSNLTGYRSYLGRVLRQFGASLPTVEDHTYTAGEVIDDLAGPGEGTFALMRSLAFHQEQGRLLRLAGLPPARLTAVLSTLARYLRSAELASDISVDNDPRENGSHAYWANAKFPFGPKSLEPVNATLYLALADEPPALIESVFHMLASLITVVALLGYLLQHNGGKGDQQADAIVAVLLLVPGILLSRLDIPSTHTVLGVLRIFPRRVAYTSVVVTTALAVAVAAQAPQINRYDHWAVGLLGFLTASCALEHVARSLRRHSLAPKSPIVPLWLIEAMGVPTTIRRRPTDVHFDAIDLPRPIRRTRFGRGRLSRTTQALLSRLESAASALRPPQSTTTTKPHRERLESEPVSRPAEVVSAAARATAERTTGTAFRVVHQRGVDSTFSPGGGHSNTDECRSAIGSLGFTAYGATYEVTTRLVDDPKALESPSFVVSLDRRAEQSFSVASGVVVTTSRNPGALRNVNEILLQLGDRPDASYRQAWMTTHILGRLTDLLVECQAVPVWVHAPAAPPPVMSRITEHARLSVAPCIRLALANSPEHAAGRIRFEVAACRLAREFGLGVYLAEGRNGFGTSYWRPVVDYTASTYRTKRRAMTEGLPGVAPEEQVMLTLIGPSSRQTTENLRELAKLVRDLDLGLLAASAWQIHQTSFVHLLLPRRRLPVGSGMYGGDRLDDKAMKLIAEDPVTFLKDTCRLTDVTQPAAAGLRWPPAYDVALADYVALPQRPEADGRVVPFWVAWDLPQSMTGVDTLTELLVTSFKTSLANWDQDCHEEPGAWVTFVRAKRHADERMRGYAKLSVRVPQKWINDNEVELLGALAKRAQETSLNEILGVWGGLPHSVNLHVAWGERWLGRRVTW